MYSGDIITRLQAIESSVEPVAPVAEISQYSPGARVLAQVGERLADGLFKVVAGGTTLQLALPAGTSPGQEIQLRQLPGGRWTVAEPPAPVMAQVEEQLADGLFKVAVAGRSIQIALPPQTQIGQQVALRQTPSGRWQPVEAAEYTAPATLTDVSDSARLVDLLRQLPPEQTRALPNPAPLLNAAPAAEAGASLPAALAKALAGALTGSGLFYESHLQQWNAGERPLYTLGPEPQTQLDLNNAAQSEVDTAKPGVPGTATAAATPDTTAESMLSAGVHPDALPIISQQLATLETGRLSWNGSLWPGQELRWEIFRDDESAERSADDSGADVPGSAEPVWRTRLAISFPQLGAVTANIALQGGAVSLQLCTPDPATQTRLGAAQPALAGALATAGLSIKKLGIGHDPAA
jgi:flagellar hook-length control protein FliK